MEPRKNILDELKEISPAVANLGRESTYTLPPGYFESFPAGVWAKIREEEQDFGRKENLFYIPEGYFETLAGNILSRVKQQQTVQEELEELSPLLNTINKQPVFSVPEGYFESLELTIPLKLDKPSARIFSFVQPKKWMQYAAAALIAGALFMGVYLVSSPNSGSDTAAVISWDSAVNMDVSKELGTVQEDIITGYLDETPVIGYAMYINSDEPDIEQYIRTVSDDEIKQYLDETGTNEHKYNGS